MKYDVPSSLSGDVSISTESTGVLVTPKKAILTVAILVLVNSLNYMDRFTIAGIPSYVKSFYSINDQQLGLLQTVFFISYTLFSPVAGYFGDRWHRKYIMILGLVLWVIVTLSSSFVPAHLFSLFLVTRCFVGVGEASYSTLAPTIISDLYSGNSRVRVLGLFYFAAPVGSGLGYVIGSAMVQWTGYWQWALRITPFLGIICVILLACLHYDPPRGQAEGAVHMETTSWGVDLRYLLVNPVFMFVSGGFTCVCFILGAVSWFGVLLIQLGISARYDDPAAWQSYDIPLIFGICLCISGIVGVLLGTYLSRHLRQFFSAADAFVCAAAQFLCAPLLFFALLSPSRNFYLCVVLVFVVDMLLCISWALVADMTMGVVIPNRRATAAAVQMIMTHALGDCISPAVVGAISDAISDSPSLEMRYLSLQRALFLTPFIGVLGGFLFLWASQYLLAGKEAVQLAIEESRLRCDISSSGNLQVSPPPELI